VAISAAVDPELGTLVHNREAAVAIRRRGLLPTVGQEVALQSPPLAGVAGNHVRCDVDAGAPPFVTLRPLDEPPAVRPEMPVLLTFASRRGLVDLEGVVAELLGSGHVVVRLTLPPHRRHARHRLNLRVDLQWLGRDEPAVDSCFSVDVSAGGLQALVREPVSRGERVFVTISLPGRAPVQAIGKVARQPVSHGGGWQEVGLEFTTISEDHRSRLVQFLSRQP
jgi:hypothetical protein